MISRPRSRIGADCNGCRRRNRIVEDAGGARTTPERARGARARAEARGQALARVSVPRPGGAGKRTLAREVAATLLAHGAPDPASAQARALAGAHPDLTWVVPSGAHEILVSDIDQPVVAAASRTPFESARRVFVIEGAEQLGDEAANRLLKTLEEPASFVHLILITDRLADVLPTIRSRCQVVRFDAPAVEELAAELSAAGVAAEVAQAYARLSLGDAGRARALAEPEGVELRERALELVRRALAGEVGAAAPWDGLLAAVRARGERVRVELEERQSAELELLPSRDRKRAETEWGERTQARPPARRDRGPGAGARSGRDVAARSRRAGVRGRRSGPEL